MKEIKRDGSIISYNIYGSGEITLLFVHGSYIDQTFWKDQVDYFSKEYKVVTFDLPGHGKSGKERKHWTVDGFAKDVNTVISELNLENVILIGHSLGVDINLIAATSETQLLLGFVGIENLKNAATPLDKLQVDEILNNLKKDFVNTNEQYARMVLFTKDTPAHIVDQIVKVYRNAYQPMGQDTILEVFNLANVEKRLLPQLKFKLYMINVDYMPTNEDPLKHYAGSGYEVLHMQGTCHFPMLENPHELNRLLEHVILKIGKEISKAVHFTAMGQ